jgi:hypothetical protein
MGNLYFGYENRLCLRLRLRLDPRPKLSVAARRTVSCFERLFDYVFVQYVAQGLLAGNMQAVNSAPVKANAVLEKQLASAIGLYVAGGND